MTDLKIAPTAPTNRNPDTTPPPTPTLLRAVAYDVIPRDDVQPAQARGRGDPAYLEFGNVEAGTTFQLVNRSKTPSATFNDPADVVQLSFDANDLKNRRVAVGLSAEKMKELDLQSGDRLMVRAVDRAGNASAPLNFELSGDYTPQGAASRELRMMSSAYQDVVVNAVGVPDSRPPVLVIGNVRVLPAPVTYDASGQPKVPDSRLTLIEGQNAAEPSSLVTVQNSRTGEARSVAVRENGGFKVSLTAEPGDAIVFSVTDSNRRLQERAVTVRYAPECPTGLSGPDLGWSVIDKDEERRATKK